MAKEKLNIYKPAKVVCACGSEFDTMSTKDVINVEVCSNCHPFYNGQKTRVSRAGKVEKFNAKYGYNQENNGQN